MAWLTRLAVVLCFVAIGMVPFGGRIEGGEALPWKVTALRMAHLLSFATAWGAALWVTFVGGIIMFKNLPRHQFGNLQGKMFPAYFAMVGVCEAACLCAFGMVHPWSSASTAPVHKLQILLLLSSLLFTLSNLLIFTPLTMNVFEKGDQFLLE